MHKAVLTLLVGLMLSTSILTGDSWAVDQINAPNCTAVEKQILKAEAAGLERCGPTAPKDCFDYLISENASYFIKYKAGQPSYYFDSGMYDGSQLSRSFEPRQFKYLTKLEEFEPVGQAVVDNCGLVKQYDKALDVDLPWPGLFKPAIKGSLYLHGIALWRNNSEISLDIALLDAKAALADSLDDGELESTIEKVGSNSFLSTDIFKNKLVEPADTNLIVTDINQLFFPRSQIYFTQLLVEYVPGASGPELLKRLNDKRLCEITYDEKKSNFIKSARLSLHVAEAKRRGLTCRFQQSGSIQTKNTNDTSAELDAERKQRIEAEAELAALKAEKEQQQVKVEADNQVPSIDILSVESVGKQGLIKGRVSDNTGVAEVVVDGFAVPLTSTGSFEYRTFVPANGISVQVQATDLAGLTSIMSVSLERSASSATAAITFDRLNPLGKQVAANRDALALIVGVADYENTPAKAIFADSDALMFRDYASEKLGIPENRITTLVDDGADERQLLLSVKNWLSRAIRQNQSDVYIFFAGHGLASDDGEKMYLLPYDGAPELLEDTAVSRDRLFADIAAANPRSVTVFLDTCYSGTTRGPDMLIASRPIAIRAKEQAIPEGFTVMTAAAGDQTAKPLEEVKHGMFSYFLMKGMEGDADANQDNQITAGELHAYVQQNVIQQSSGSQTPELQGDADRVLVRFQ